MLLGYTRNDPNEAELGLCTYAKSATQYNHISEMSQQEAFFDNESLKQTQLKKFATNGQDIFCFLKIGVCCLSLMFYLDKISLLLMLIIFYV